MPATKPSVYIAYPDGISRVRVISLKVNKRSLVRPLKKPVLVEDEDGDRFAIDAELLYNDPVSASIASAKLAKEHGIEPAAEEEDEEEEDLEEEEDEEDEEDEDEDADEEEDAG